MISENSKTIAKNTIILNIRLVIVLAINLAISRLVLQNLGVTDYGLYTLVGGFVSLLSIITSSIAGTAQRFITYELGKGNEKYLTKTFSNILNVLIIIALGVLVVGVVLGLIFIKDYLNIPQEKGKTALFVYFCSLTTFVINLVMVPYIALVNAHEHMHWYAVVSIFDAIIKLGVVASLAFFVSSRVEIYALLLMFASVASFLLYYVYCRKHFPESEYKKDYDKEIVKKMFSFSVWMGLGSAAGTIKDQGGNILVNIFFGLTLNASMGIANQIRGLLGQFANNIGAAIAPQITKSYAEGQVDRSIRLTFFRTKCQGIFILLIAIPLLVYTDEILHVWLGEVPDYSSMFVRQMCFVCLFNSLEQGFGPLFLAIGEIKKYEIFQSVILFLYIPLTWVVLKISGEPALSLLFNILLEFFFVFANFYELKLKIGFPFVVFLKKVILRVAVCFAVSLAFAFLIKGVIIVSNIIMHMLGVTFIVVVFAIMSYIIILEKSERDVVLSYVRKFKKK